MCGYTTRQINALTLPQVRETFEYWREFPPAHEHLLIMSGYKAPGAPTPNSGEAMGPEDFIKFVQSTGGRQLSPNG